ELEKICRKVLKEASELASHARRKVIKVEDVLLVKIR
ncbi:MAG TPA: histone, partial [Candidatus Aenigmarchaeota archaeon]|nr:histone [Candidatus Aenigmarchaeota archaeon]